MDDMHHYPWKTYKYLKNKRSDNRSGECPFCNIDQMNARAVRTTETMYVIPNRTKYDLFEGIPVLDHLMIVPKERRVFTKEFTPEERREMFNLIAEYETKGYHFFGRGINAVSRSVKHQHTHLIKVSERPVQVLLHIRSLRLLLGK
jgi:diadenosine tetraphosphate (Ap4A) HIT family hydrolase